MPCYHPVAAYRPAEGGPIHFKNNGDGEITIPCRQCIGCKLEYARDWATRCMHEAQMHVYNNFLTLTYNNENLPDDLSLRPEHWVTFAKALRSALHRKKYHRAINSDKLGFRYYMGGEYIPETGRPHYHACLFGIDFQDKIYHKTTPAGSKIYKSPTLDKLWGKGYSSIGQVTFQSAGYIARYCIQKRTGDGNPTHYEILDPDTGEIRLRRKEYNHMSRMPGLGKSWLLKYHPDIYTTGKVRVRNATAYPPRYYDKVYEDIDHERLYQLQYQRLRAAVDHQDDNTPERLRVKEQVQQAKLKYLSKGLDFNETANRRNP